MLSHLQSGLLDSDLAEDACSVVGTHSPQLLLVEGEQLGSGQHTQAIDGAEGKRKVITLMGRHKLDTART